MCACVCVPPCLCPCISACLRARQSVFVCPCVRAACLIVCACVRACMPVLLLVCLPVDLCMVKLHFPGQYDLLTELRTVKTMSHSPTAAETPTADLAFESSSSPRKSPRSSSALSKAQQAVNARSLVGDIAELRALITTAVDQVRLSFDHTSDRMFNRMFHADRGAAGRTTPGSRCHRHIDERGPSTERRCILKWETALCRKFCDLW